MKPITLSDDQWTKILEFLRTRPDLCVGREENCRRFVEGALWMLCSGAQWRLRPDEYGKWNSVHSCVARWCDKGIWERMMAHFAQDPDLENVMLDSTVVRAHPCAAGALKKRRTGRAGAGAWSWRVQHQNPCQSRRAGLPPAFSSDRWRTPNYHPG